MLPNRALNREELSDLRNRGDTKLVVPLYLERDSGIEVVAFTEVTDGTLFVRYYTGVWNLLAEWELEDEPVVHVDDLLNPTASFIGTDAKVVRRLAKELGEKLEETMGVGFVPYSRLDESPADLERGECPCNGLDAESVQRVPTPSDTGNGFVYACLKCFQVHGLEYEGQKRTLERVAGEDWLFGDTNPGQIEEIGDDSRYLLRTVGDGVGRLERVIDALSVRGGARSHSFSQFEPDLHEAMACIDDGQVAGYLSWEELDGMQVIRQLFVREEYRRQGIASDLVSGWCETVCAEDTYSSGCV